MEFCSMCRSMLMLELNNPTTRFYCKKTCPYVWPIERGVKLKRKQMLVKKGIEPTYKVPCPNCRHGEVAYKEVLNRSSDSDEPIIIFYACLNENCKHIWNE